MTGHCGIQHLGAVGGTQTQRQTIRHQTNGTAIMFNTKTVVSSLACLCLIAASRLPHNSSLGSQHCCFKVQPCPLSMYWTIPLEIFHVLCTTRNVSMTISIKYFQSTSIYTKTTLRASCDLMRALIGFRFCSYTEASLLSVLFQHTKNH